MTALNDGICYHAVVAREYHKLHRLTVTPHPIIKSIWTDKQYDETEYHACRVVEYEIAWRYYYYVACHDDRAKWYWTVFVYYGSNDVRATCRAIVFKAYGKSSTGEQRANDRCHERLIAHKLWENHLPRIDRVGFFEDVLHQPKPECYAQHPPDSFQAEP